MSTAAIDYSRYQCLKIEKANKLATVTLNQPDTGNRIEHRFQDRKSTRLNSSHG